MTNGFATAALGAVLAVMGMALPAGATEATQLTDPSVSSRVAAFGLSIQRDPAFFVDPAAWAAAAQPDGMAHASRDLMWVGADGAAVESGVLYTEADAAMAPSIESTLPGLSANTATPPSAWDARGFSSTSDLQALRDSSTGLSLLTVDEIGVEAVATCEGEDIIFGTAARKAGIELAGVALDGVIADAPNQTYEADGVRIVFWETTFDEAEGTVSVNGLHVVVDGGLDAPDTDIILAHSEASVSCPGSDPAPEPRMSACDSLGATLCGTSDADEMADTSGNDVIVTGGGNDTITITGGSDMVRSGAGDDVIIVESGTVEVHAGAGDDVIRCSTGADRVFAGSGSDLIVCGAGSDLIRGGHGNDQLYGNRGEDRLFGDAGNDMMFGGEGRDVLHGGPGRDTYRD